MLTLKNVRQSYHDLLHAMTNIPSETLLIIAHDFNVNDFNVNDFNVNETLTCATGTN